MDMMRAHAHIVHFLDNTVSSREIGDLCALLITVGMNDTEAVITVLTQLTYMLTLKTIRIDGGAARLRFSLREEIGEDEGYV